MNCKGQIWLFGSSSQFGHKAIVMKIACISASTVPSGTANSIQAMKVCQSLAQVGNEVRLWLPGSRAAPWAALAEQYGLETSFPIDWLAG